MPPRRPTGRTATALAAGINIFSSDIAGAFSALPTSRSRAARHAFGGSSFRIAVCASAICAAYYVGAVVGLALRVPTSTPSMLWPPNAILTAALLLTPPRHWWVYLLAAFPAHLLIELDAGWDISFVILLFATNCSEALLAASGMRWLSDAPTRFDTVRRVLVFLGVVVIVAPVLSSFADAAAVALLNGEPYWLVWRSRCLSNTLTALTFVPAIVTTITLGPARLRQATARQWFEAMLLALCVLAIGLDVLAGPITGHRALPGSPITTLAFLLPLLLWAAVRFGTGGVSLVMLATALLIIGAAMRGTGPFQWVPPGKLVPALQIFLTVTAVPFMYLAAVIYDRHAAAAVMGERLRFEQLLSRLSRTILHLPSPAIGPALAAWLQEFGEYVRVDATALLQFSSDGRALVVEAAWTRPGVPPIESTDVSGNLPWAVDRLRRETPVAISCVANLPETADTDAAALLSAGIKSKLLLPLVANGRVFGGLAVMTMNAEREWPDALVVQLQLIAEVLSNALARSQADHAVRRSEAMKSAILASMASGVALLDSGGRIVAVNESWTRLAQAPGVTPEAVVGATFQEAYLPAARAGAEWARAALPDIERVLLGHASSVAHEYPISADCWYAVSAVPLNVPEGGAVVTLTDISERKHAEHDSQRTRQELAHFTRVSVMGELAASLAHQLNQPLTSILSNAQVARRMLTSAPPNVTALPDIVADIIEEDKRAGEVIQRLREMLRRGALETPVLLDLNAVVSDVVRLVSSDAVIRRVSLKFDADTATPVVSGGRVELQQVVLNLIMNAMDAVAGEPPASRLVSVQTRAQPDTSQVLLTVLDSGPGIAPQTEERVFEPFYSTKPSGMGIGLSVARSIVRSHGGTICAFNADEGARFELRLPLASPEGPMVKG